MTDINGIERAVKVLIESVQKGDVRRACESNLCLVGVIGPSALNCLTHELYAALRKKDSKSVVALGIAILEIWEKNESHPKVSQNKEKMRTLLSGCPPISPQISMMLHDLRQAIKPGASAHPSETFLRGPSYKAISDAISRQKYILKNPICKN